MKRLLLGLLLVSAGWVFAEPPPEGLAMVKPGDLQDVHLFDTTDFTKKSMSYAGKVIRLRFTHRQNGVVAPKRGWFELEVASGNPGDYYSENAYVRCELPTEAASLMEHIETWDQWIKRPMTGKIITIYAYVDDKGTAWGLGREVKQDDFSGKSSFNW
jgi:hypothetical protein